MTAVSAVLFRAHAQEPRPPATPAEDEVVRVNTDLVAVPVVVTDGRNRRVAGLGRQDFSVRDSGRPVSITYFAPGAERVAVAFVLDASGSARDIIARQQETALALFSRFGPRSRVAVLHFSERPELAVPFTADAAEARAGFRLTPLPNRRTAIFDAALAAAGAYREGDPAERRVAVIISDGLDNASVTSAAAVIDEANRRGVSFYVIHLPLYTPRAGRLVPRAPSRGFREMAEKTGGRYFVVGDAQASLDPRAEYDLEPVFQAIAEDLRGQYVLGYYLDEATRREAGAARRVEVRLNAAVGRKLRVRNLRETYTLRDQPPTD